MQENIKLIIAVLSIVMWGYNIFCLYHFKIKAAFMPFIATNLIGVLLLILGMADLLPLGRMLIYVSGFFLFIFFIKKDKSGFKQYISDCGIIFYLVMAVIIVIIACTKDMNYHIWDETSHWGPFFKNIFYTESLPAYANYPMTHGLYSQLCPVIYYYFSFGMSEFNEAGTYAVVLLEIMACTSTIFYIIPRKRKGMCLLVGTIAATFLVFFPDMYPYNSIYLDALVSVMGGAVIVLIYSMNGNLANRDIFQLVTILILAFSQVKTSGLPIALMCSGFYFVCLLIEKSINKREIYKAFVRMLLMVFLVLFFYKIYQVFFNYMGGIDSIAVTKEKSVDAIRKCYEDWKLNGMDSFWIKMTKAYILGLFERKIGFLPYVGWLALLVIMAIIAGKSGRIEKLDKIILWLLPISTAVLIFLLYGRYMSRKHDRALLLYSYERYITPIVVGCLMMLLVITIKYGIYVKKQIVLYTFVGALAVICGTKFWVSDDNNYFKNSCSLEEIGRSRYRSISDQVENIIEQDAKVWIICQGNLGNVAYYYQYEFLSHCIVLAPMPSSTAISCRISETIRNPESGTPEYTQIAVEEFAHRVEKHNVGYILIDYVDDEFKNGYGELFSDGVMTGNDWDVKLYKVVPDKQRYQLVGVYSEVVME